MRGIGGVDVSIVKSREGLNGFNEEGSGKEKQFGEVEQILHGTEHDCCVSNADRYEGTPGPCFRIRLCDRAMG